MLQKIQRAFFLSIILGAFSCSVSAAIEEVADSDFTTNAPDLSPQPNEVEIASTFQNANATFVLGAIVDRTNRSVRGLDSYLRDDAAPRNEPSNEQIFDSYVDQKLAGNGGFFSFLKISASDNTKLHITMTKESIATIENRNIDKEKLLRQVATIREQDRERYGVIIGYVAYKINAKTYSEVDAESDAGANGIKVSGNFYKHSGNDKTTYKVIALWSPLPFAVEQLDKEPSTNLVDATTTAINNREINVQPINGEIKAVAPKN